MTPEELKQFKEWQVPLPARESHGEDSPNNPISDNLQKLELRNWRLIGNKLTADTQFGQYVYLVSPDLKMTGLDDKGLPILEKIVI